MNQNLGHCQRVSKLVFSQENQHVVSVKHIHTPTHTHTNKISPPPVCLGVLHLHMKQIQQNKREK